MDIQIIATQDEARWLPVLQEAQRELSDEGFAADLLLVVIDEDEGVLFMPSDERAQPIIVRPTLTDGRHGSRLDSDLPTNSQLHEAMFVLAQEISR